ncbi:MAG TPA: PilN domain-containing protein [Acidisoma sp.]|nr:PilN domain-containing protein [Acidisoma sp.]
MMAEYFEWWTRQWIALLPSSLKPASGSADVAISVSDVTEFAERDIALSRTGQAPVFLKFNSEGLTALRSMSGGRQGGLRLQLPPGSILERTVSLPAAVERDLGQVLHYEIDRLTPFAAGDVFWDWALLRHDKQRGKLDIQLRLVKRDLLAPLLAALHTGGVYPDCLESRGSRPGQPPRLIWLQREASKQARHSPQRLIAYAVCATLFLTLCVTPFLRQYEDLARLDRQITALQPTVRDVARFRRMIATDSESNDVLRVERRATGNPLQILAAVTDALPDGTWLTQLSLQQRALHLEGESHAAVQLISRLAAASQLSNPAFAAPVTTDPDHHADIFAISAEVRP